MKQFGLLALALMMLSSLPIQAQTGFDAGLVLEDYALLRGSRDSGTPDFSLGNQSTARAYFLLEGSQWSLSLRGRLDLPQSVLEYTGGILDSDFLVEDPDGDIESLVLSGNLSRTNSVFQRLGLRFGRFVIDRKSVV